MGDDARWQAVTAGLAGHPGVALPEAGRRRFGHETLQVGGSIFAMRREGSLVLKLPAERVAALIEAGAGAAFGARGGAPMRQWVSVSGGDEREWLALAREALAFVAAERGASASGGSAAAAAQSPSGG